LFVHTHADHIQITFLDSNITGKPPKLKADGIAEALGLNFSGSEEKNETTHVCEQTFVVTSTDDKSAKCPKACPYYAQNKKDTLACSFICVRGEDCLRWNPNAGIPDDELNICRGPSVEHCQEFDGVTDDRCKVCQVGYRQIRGTCHSKYVLTTGIITGLLLTVVGALVAWIVDMARRPVTNEAGLKSAKAFHENSKLHMPKERGHRRRLWPLTTNLCRELVAGPGMCLHFNFQAVFIVWPVCVALGWCFMAWTVDEHLFVIGTRKFGTPRDNCHLISWGFETQQRLMWTKVHFTYWLYVLCFIGIILHNIRQLRCFQSVDYDNKTMKDFAAFVDGIPEQSGDSNAEEVLKAAIEEATGRTLVGVSIAWDFHEFEEDVQHALARELKHLGTVFDSPTEADREANALEMSESTRQAALQMPSWRRHMLDWELKLFHTENEMLQNDAEDEIAKVLKKMKSSSQAFAVFTTEQARDDAVVAAAEKGGISFDGATITLEAMQCEPDTVQWENFGHTSLFLQVLRILQGFGFILLALLLWALVFYVPYAYSLYSFNYANGQQPGAIYSIAFTMVVVIGNAIMYEVCARISDFVRFHFRDARETTYMVLYTVACTFNVLLDFVMTYIIAYKVIKGLEFRTYYGVPIEHVDRFIDRFESYAMQRILADNSFSYLFPSTCLVPFLLEPIITIIGPMWLGIFIVRSHPEIVGQEADSYLLGPPMEMGRYADIILNVILANLILFFPGGYTHTLFFGMAFSHVYIYIFDHYRVFRSVPACTFASNEVDWWSQVMLIPCCGMVLMCAIFKANAQGYGYFLEGNTIVWVCIMAFFAHFFVHLMMLIFVVPLFGKKTQENPDLDVMTFGEVNQHLAASWFSTNPIHCLRSQKIYQHMPHCVYLFRGHEDLLQVNEEIGCYFQDDKGTTPPLEEDMDWREAKDLARMASLRLTQGFRRFHTRESTNEQILLEQ